MSVADAKRKFADLLGRVAYGGETFVITRRGKPMAKLVPVEGKHAPGLAGRGWLEADDPFFEIVDEIIAARSRHRPRVLEPPRRRETRARRSRARVRS